jgi:hypothetical protein
MKPDKLKTLCHLHQEKMVEEFPVTLASSDRMILLEVLDLKILKEYPSREALLTSDGLKFYTDGSLFKGTVGSGVFSDKLDLKESFAFGSFASVLQTEFHAILACSDYCLKKMQVQSAITRTVELLY